MTLRARVTRGLFWEGGAALIAQVMSFVVSLLLTRLLVAEYFGLISIATLAIQSLLLLQEMGFSAALIYRQDNVEEAAHTAHWAIIASSLLLYAAAFVLSPLWAGFFRSPEVTPVLRVLALTIVIGSFSRVPYTLLAKELDFRKKVLPEVLGSILGNSAALLTALLGWRVWAIVAGELVSATLVTLLVYGVSAWRPRRLFNIGYFRELLSYGKHVTASQLLIFGITNIDDVFVGRMAGKAALGYYGIAYKVSNTPATTIARMVSRVTLPAFSLLQNDIARLRSTFFRQMHLIAAVAMPIGAATVLFAHDFVYAVMNDHWSPAILPMQILAVYGVIRALASSMGSVFQAAGKPQWLAGIALWRFLTMAALLYPATRWGGVVGVSWLSAGVAVVDFALSAYLANRILQARAATYATITLPLLLCAVLAGALGFGLNRALLAAGLWDVAALLAGGLLMGLLYALLIWRFDPELRQELTKLSGWLRGGKRSTL
ncbi:MAG: lipopolysaccharide biosynthesis protein [Caldilineales bacterium]